MPFIRRGIMGTLDKYPAAIPPQYADTDYLARGGRVIEMSPDELLGYSTPLELDDVARDNIDDLKRMMLSGQQIDPPSLYSNDGSVSAMDGRHRAIAAKELGLESIPVVDLRPQEPRQQSLTDTLSGYSDEALRMLQKSALDEGKADEAARYGAEIASRIENPLTAIHNTTSSGILAADELGGIPAPSHAIVRPDQEFSGFGDISLIARRDMVDPEMGQPLFGSDVYSRRQPKPLYRVAKKVRSPEANAIRQAMEEFQDSHRWEFSDWLERGDPRELRASGSEGFMAAYARANGVDVPGPKSPMSTAERYNLEREIRDLKGEYDGEFNRLSNADPEFDPVKAAESQSLRSIGERLSAARAKLDDARGPSAYEIRGMLEEAGVDPYGAEKWLTDGLLTFGDWRDPYFERGRKKVDYTVENLADYMNARVRGEEQTMTEGLGKQRSGSVKRFKSIDQAKKASDSIVGADEFKAFQESTNEDLFAIADKVESPYSSHFNKIDDVSRAVGDVMKGMSPAAALRKHELSGDVEDELRSLADRVKNGPTEYFESKFQGVAQLGDYAGAIVPENTPDDVVRLLQAKGLQVERYSDEAGRAAARSRIPGSTFMFPIVAGAAALASQEAEAAPMGTLRDGIKMATRQAYHGSPHDFDKFSLAKIGTGEGAQAYGHGLYFSSSEDIAKFYRDSLTGYDARFVKDGVDSNRTEAYRSIVDAISNPDLPEDKAKSIADAVIQGKLDGDDADHMRRFIRKSDWDLPEKEAWLKALDQADEYSIEIDEGKLYTVEIPDESNMLDWDKPLSEQPEAVQKALGVPSLERLKEMEDEALKRLIELENAGLQRGPEGDALRAKLEGIAQSINRYHVNTTAGDYYNRLALDMGGREKVSESLREAGIPGITYKGATSGERNFVVFDDEHINMIQKGLVDPKLLAPMAAGAATIGYATSEFAAAESSLNATEDDLRASSERFKALRKGKRAQRLSQELERVLAPVAGPAKALMDATEVMLVGVAGGIPGYLSELTGYVRGQDLEEAKAGGEALAGKLTGSMAEALGEDWDPQNPYLQGLAKAMEQGEKEFQDAYRMLGVENSVMKKGWDQLPERAQRIITGLADLAL